MKSVEKTSDTHTLWHPLHQASAHCIELARDLGRRLQAGDAGLQLQPLLEESAAQIGQLRQGIRDLARRGVAAITFDFRNSGESDGHFERTLPSDQLADARHLHAWMRNPGREGIPRALQLSFQ